MTRWCPDCAAAVAAAGHLCSSGWCPDCAAGIAAAGHLCGSGQLEIAGQQVDGTWTLEPVVCRLPRCVMCELAQYGA